MSRRITATLVVAALMVLAAVAPAWAQPNQTGLVNVNVSGNTIQLPISVAANVCNVDVAVLVEQINQTGTATCDARGNSRANG
jgi:hypothetical protein